MHICFVTQAYHGAPGDIFMPAMVEMVERIADIHEVTVISLRHPSRRPTFEMGGATVICLGHATAGGLPGRARVLGSGLAAVLRRHRRRPIDIVHGLWVDEAGAVATVAGRLLRRPSVASVMGGELVALHDIGYGAALGLGGRLTARVTLRLAGVVTAQSSHTLALARERGRADARRLPLGVNRELFHPSDTAAAEGGQSTGQRRALYVGNLVPVKDPMLLVNAFARVARERDVGLDVVGVGSLRPTLEARIDDLGLRERVVFHGHRSQAELAQMYRAASVLVIPSRYESQSVVAVEAVASGLPVIGTDVGIVPDLGDAALVVPTRDEAALANALVQFLDDPQRAARMKRAAELVAEQLDIRATSQVALDLYEELAGQRAAS